jgi:hypothetical protein
MQSALFCVYWGVGVWSPFTVDHSVSFCSYFLQFLLHLYDRERTYKILCFVSLVVLESLNCCYTTVMLENGTGTSCKRFCYSSDN